MSKKRRQQTRSGQAEWSLNLEVVHPNAAGIDIGNESHYAAVAPDRDPNPVRQFACFTEDLHRLADWLKICCIDTVAMQSTGVYWLSAYEILTEKGLKVFLVNTRHTKNLPGVTTHHSRLHSSERFERHPLLLSWAASPPFDHTGVSDPPVK